MPAPSCIAGGTAPASLVVTRVHRITDVCVGSPEATPCWKVPLALELAAESDAGVAQAAAPRPAAPRLNAPRRVSLVMDLSLTPG